MAIKQLHLTKTVNQELNLIAAEINAKSKTSFAEDLFLHVHINNSLAIINPSFEIIETDVKGDVERISLSLDNDTSYFLRLQAVKLNTSQKEFMQSILVWLANEHRENGRVWIDDTPVRALPVRMRK